MSARDEILSSIRARKLVPAPVPETYVPPPRPEGDLVDNFVKRASTQYADVRLLGSMNDVADAVADILRGRNMAPQIHIASDSPLGTLALGNVETFATPPAQNDAALTIAPFGIAATGTLAYPSAKGAPSSWHFRPVLEIAVLHASSIVGELEDVLAKIGTMPATLNLVTGPSRTGDIEQTMELGAHGPKGLAILIVRD